MPQYVEGPEAKAMETGFALDELLRREAGASKRQARQLGFGAAQQQAQQAQEQTYALERMVKGDELKEAAAQREAERTAPFLQQLISGNPKVAQAFGFTETKPAQIDRQGAMAEPEAAGIPAPVAPPQVVPRMPSREEVTGLSRAVPGIAQALLNKSLDPQAGFTLSPGQIRFDAMGNVIARGAPQDVGMTLDQAQAIKDHIEKQDPTNVGRVSLQSHEKGGWTVQLNSQTPLTPPDPIKQGYWDRIKGGTSAKDALAWYTRESANAAGERQLQISINTPPTEAALQADDKVRTTLDAFNNLKAMNDVAPALVREFLTWKGTAADLYSYLNRVPGMQSIVGPQGLNQQEFLARYEDWAASMGRLRAGSFDLGGKQLTPFEDSVVRMTIPTKQDSPEGYSAKMNWLGSYYQAQQHYVAWARVTPKIQQTGEAQAQAWAMAKQKAGIDTTKAADYNRFMSPDDRVREKVRQ